MTKLILIGPQLNSKQTYDFEEKVIFVDGGMDFKNNISHQGFDSIGDQDSTHCSLNNVLDKNKDRSDLYHAFELANEHKNLKELDLYGFMGGRLDHQLFNIGEGYRFIERSTTLESIHFYNKKIKEISIFKSGHHLFNFEGQFSISTLKNCSINLSGKVEYSGSIDLIPMSSQGLSNIAHGEFEIKSDQPIIFFYTT